MTLLLDTHILLWFLSSDPKLPSRSQAEIIRPTNRVFVSVVSVWECVQKHSLGKLPFPQPPAFYLPSKRVLHNFESLPIDELVFPTLASLPMLHRDPFDRMLIAQAVHHNLTLVTVDPQIRAYPVPTL